MHFDSLSFVKVHGLGNDFVLLNGIAHDLASLDFSAFAIAACERHRGIGSDGLLLLARSQTADVQMRMWNPDGSEDMCGNGLRCVARVAHLRGYVTEQFEVETLAGLRTARIEADGQVRVSMGAPSWNAPEIPMLAVAPPHQYDLEIGGEILRASSLSTGSTHTILWRDALPEDAEFFRISPQIENHPWFPERTSVLWACVKNNEITLRIWERGAGETLACGTGACAAAVAAIDTARIAGETVVVQSKGGALRIEWTDQIYKTGPAQVVYEGIWH